MISQIIDDYVVVDIQRSSACATCESKSACTTLDARTQQISCQNNGDNLKIGDSVNIVSERKQSFYAVIVAFAIPLLLFILAIIICSEFFKLNEGLSAITAFTAIALYYIVLHLFDNKIKNKINFRIEKQIN